MRAQQLAAAAPLRTRILRWLTPWVARWATRILRSPWHGLVSSHLLVLEYVDGETGLHHSLPLSYVTLGGTPYCVALPPGWPSGPMSPRDVHVRIGGRTRRASATRLTETSTEARVVLANLLRAAPESTRLFSGVHVAPQEPHDDRQLYEALQRAPVLRLTLAHDEGGATTP